MRWMGRRQSGNIEDRRSGGGGLAIGGGLTAIVALVFSLLTGQNPMELLGMFQGDSGGAESQQEAPLQTDVNQDEKGHFVAVVLADTEDVWNKIFSQSGSRYQEPTLVLFKNSVSKTRYSRPVEAPVRLPDHSIVRVTKKFI
jgi:uncharacterized protein